MTFIWKPCADTDPAVFLLNGISGVKLQLKIFPNTCEFSDSSQNSIWGELKGWTWFGKTLLISISFSYIVQFSLVLSDHGLLTFSVQIPSTRSIYCPWSITSWNIVSMVVVWSLRVLFSFGLVCHFLPGVASPLIVFAPAPDFLHPCLCLSPSRCLCGGLFVLF